MNNENEIIKEFNETFGNNNEPSVEPYQATQNNFMATSEVNNVINPTIPNNSQNITMPNFINQNPQVNMVPEINNTVIVENNANNVNTTNNAENSNLVNNQTSIQNNDNQQLYNTTNYINDTDRPIEKKTKKATIKINPELKSIILIAIILLVAMLFIPTLFDLYDSLKIKIFG